MLHVVYTPVRVSLSKSSGTATVKPHSKVLSSGFKVEVFAREAEGVGVGSVRLPFVAEGIVSACT